MPVHVLERSPSPAHILEVTVEGEVVGQHSTGGGADVGALLPVQALFAVIVVRTAIVEVTAAVLIDTWASGPAQAPLRAPLSGQRNTRAAPASLVVTAPLQMI
jgi:hypothetical protein